MYMRKVRHAKVKGFRCDIPASGDSWHHLTFQNKHNGWPWFRFLPQLPWLAKRSLPRVNLGVMRRPRQARFRRYCQGTKKSDHCLDQFTAETQRERERDGKHFWEMSVIQHVASQHVWILPKSGCWFGLRISPICKLHPSCITKFKAAQFRWSSSSMFWLDQQWSCHERVSPE